MSQQTRVTKSFHAVWKFVDELCGDFAGYLNAPIPGDSIVVSSSEYPIYRLGMSGGMQGEISYRKNLPSLKQLEEFLAYQDVDQKAFDLALSKRNLQVSVAHDSGSDFDLRFSPVVNLLSASSPQPSLQNLTVGMLTKDPI